MFIKIVTILTVTSTSQKNYQSTNRKQQLGYLRAITPIKPLL